MRKSKGIIALAAAVTMLLTAIQPVGFAEDAASIVIAGRSATAVEYTYDGVKYRNDNEKYVQWANDNAFGAENMHISSRTPESTEYPADVTKFSDGITLEYTVNIEEAGVYQLDISGSDVTHMYRSAYAVAMDDLEFKAINVLTATEVIEEPADDAFSNHGLYVLYKTPLKYNLTVGQHTFKVKLTGKVANDEKKQYDACINIITFNKTTDTAVNDIYVYGLDDYSSATEGLQVGRDTTEPVKGGTQTGSAVLMRTDGGVFADRGYVVTYPFTVTETGAYRVAGLGANNQNVEWLSKVAISVDDAPYTKIIDMMAAAEPYSIEATHMRNMQVNKRYWLTEGTHYLNLWIYEKRIAAEGSSDNVNTYFDYMKLTREENADGGFSVYGTDDATNNFASLPGDYATNTKQWLILNAGSNPSITNHSEYDNKLMSVVASKTEDAFPESGITVDYPFYCAEDGWYKLDELVKNRNNGYFSSMRVGVDGAYTAFDRNSNEHITASEQLSSNHFSYKTDLLYYITEGMHTFNINVTDVAPQRGSVMVFFAEAKFTPVPESELPTSTSIRINGTAYDSAQLPAGLNPSSGAGEGGAATVQKFSSSTEDFQNPMNVIYPFTVYIPGTYNIAEVSGNDINSIYLSNYTIGIDGTMYDLADNITSTADGLTGNMKVYETGLTCDLTPGTHYLTFSITSERTEANGGGAYAFFEYVDLELEEESVLSLEITDEYVEKGGSTYVTLTSVNPRTDAVVDEVYQSVTYSSSDTSVATVEQDGTVTAVGPGKAAIIADVVRQNGEEERVSVDVKVTVNALYCEVDGFTLDGEALTELTGGIHSVGAKVNIENKMLFPGKATIVFAAYAGNTLKGIEVVSDNAVDGFYTTPYELTLDNFDMEGVTQLSVMVWNDIGDLQPIAQKTSFAD